MIAELSVTEAALVGAVAVLIGLVLGFTIIAIGRRWRKRRERREYERVIRRLADDFEAAAATIGTQLTPALRRVATAMEAFGKAIAKGTDAPAGREYPEIVEALDRIRRASTAGRGTRDAPDGDDDTG